MRSIHGYLHWHEGACCPDDGRTCSPPDGNRTAAILKPVLEQALQLTDDERGEPIARLLRSLEPDDGEELNRVRDIRDGSIELVNGDEAIARVRAAIGCTRSG